MLLNRLRYPFNGWLSSECTLGHTHLITFRLSDWHWRCMKTHATNLTIQMYNFILTYATFSLPLRNYTRAGASHVQHCHADKHVHKCVWDSSSQWVTAWFEMLHVFLVEVTTNNALNLWILFRKVVSVITRYLPPFSGNRSPTGTHTPAHVHKCVSVK